MVDARCQCDVVVLGAAVSAQMQTYSFLIHGFDRRGVHIFGSGSAQRNLHRTRRRSFTDPQTCAVSREWPFEMCNIDANEQDGERVPRRQLIDNDDNINAFDDVREDKSVRNGKRTRAH